MLDKENLIENLEMLVQGFRAKYIVEHDMATILGTKVRNLLVELEQTKIELEQAKASIDVGRTALADTESLMEIQATIIEQCDHQVLGLDRRVLQLQDTICSAQDEKARLIQDIRGLKSKVSEQEKVAYEAITDAEEMARDLEYYKDWVEQLTGKKKRRLDIN